MMILIMVRVPGMSSPECESMKPICRDGWGEKRNTDGDQPGCEEKESSIVQIVDVVDETFHIGRPQVRQV